MGDAALMVCPAGLNLSLLLRGSFGGSPASFELCRHTPCTPAASAHTLQDTYAALYTRRANASTLSSIECEQTIDSGARWRGVGRAMPPCTRPLSDA